MNVPRLPYRTVLIALGFLAAGGCSRPSTSVACDPLHALALPAAADGQPASLDAVDDRRLNDRLLREGGRLIDEGKTIETKAFIEQLGRERCELTLPDAKPIAQSPGELYDKASDGVLIVAGLYKCDRCNNWHANSASGFALTADGAVVTNHHVVANEKNSTLVVMTRAGRVLPVREVLASDKANDVAIVKVEPGDEPLTPLPVVSPAAVGEPVTVISHPDHRFYMLTTGVVSRHGLVMNEGRTVKRLFITADYAKGSSGAPVFNGQGQVIGLVASTQSIYYSVENGDPRNFQMVIRMCVPASAVLERIDRAQ